MSENSGDQGSPPYAGRWVARLEGRIVAHGGTPEAARRAARADRFKEVPEIMFVPMKSALPASRLLARVAEISRDQDVFLVGGAVRDALLGLPSHDYDFAVREDAIGLARRVASTLHSDFYVLDETFGAARVLVTSEAGIRDVLDFSLFRGPDLETDLAGRDFTLNALAFDVRQQTILDPLNGAADLSARLLKVCSDRSISDDPIRILRGIRLAAALDLKVEAETRGLMRRSVDLLPTTSPERQRDEIFRILDGPRVDSALRALEILGVFPWLLPELSALKGVRQSLPHIHDVWDHTLSVVHSLELILSTLSVGAPAEEGTGLLVGLLALRLGRYREELAAHLANALNPGRTMRSLLFLAALYHDVAKPKTSSVDGNGRVHFIGHEGQGAVVAEERCHALNLSNSETARVGLLVENHLRFFHLGSRIEAEGKWPSRRAVYRFFRDTREAGVDVILLGLADVWGARGHTMTDTAWSYYVDLARLLLENYWEKPEESVRPKPLVNGLDVMREYGLPQGPLIGELLDVVREAQAAGQIQTRQEALEAGRDWLRARRA